MRVAQGPATGPRQCCSNAQNPYLPTAAAQEARARPESVRARFGRQVVAGRRPRFPRREPPPAVAVPVLPLPSPVDRSGSGATNVKLPWQRGDGSSPQRAADCSGACANSTAATKPASSSSSLSAGVKLSPAAMAAAAAAAAMRAAMSPRGGDPSCAAGAPVAAAAAPLWPSQLLGRHSIHPQPHHAQQQQQQLQQQQHVQTQPSALPRGGRAWSADLGADITAVAQELELSPAAADALARAAQRGTISRNPGVVLSQAVRLLPLEARLGGRGALSAALARHPGLLRQDAATLALNFDVLEQLLPPGEAPRVALALPALLGLSPFRLWSSVATLAEMLQAGSSSSSSNGSAGGSGKGAAGSTPPASPPAGLGAPGAARATAAARTAAGAGRMPDAVLATAAAAAARQPRLLMAAPSTLRMRAERLGRLLIGLGGDESSSGSSKGAPQNKPTAAAAAAAAVAVVVRRAPALLTYHPETLAAKHAALAALLALPPASRRLARMLRRQPLLLALQPQGLDQRVGHLAAGLGVPRPEVLRLICSQPALLTLAADSAVAKARALGGALGVPAATAAAMVRSNPSLLTLTGQTLARKRALLLSHLAACPPAWRRELLEGSPHTLGVLLCMSDARLARLRFLGQHYRPPSAPHGGGGGEGEGGAGGEGDAALREALPWRRLMMLPDATLERRCAGWMAWSKWWVQTGGSQPGPAPTGAQAQRGTSGGSRAAAEVGGGAASRS